MCKDKDVILQSILDSEEEEQYDPTPLERGIIQYMMSMCEEICNILCIPSHNHFGNKVLHVDIVYPTNDLGKSGKPSILVNGPTEMMFVLNKVCEGRGVDLADLCDGTFQSRVRLLCAKMHTESNSIH